MVYLFLFKSSQLLKNVLEWPVIEAIGTKRYLMCDILFVLKLFIANMLSGDKSKSTCLQNHCQKYFRINKKSIIIFRFYILFHDQRPQNLGFFLSNIKKIFKKKHRQNKNMHLKRGKTLNDNCVSEPQICQSRDIYIKIKTCFYNQMVGIS